MMKSPLPKCTQCGRRMRREGAPTHGLICKCGFGITYAFAVRMGWVDELVEGDQQRAIDAYKNRLEKIRNDQIKKDQEKGGV